MLDDTDNDAALPWTSAPSDLGSEECGWCHRAIYLPALPCSVRPVGGLAAMSTVPGQGKRCQWELLTRSADRMNPAVAAGRWISSRKGLEA